MTTVVLEHPREDAKTVIKAAIERMSSIDAYTDEGQRIVGQQEASLTGGNGARLTIDVPEMQESDSKTVVEINAEKEVAIDMATNPEDIKSEFLDLVNNLRNKDIDSLLQEISEDINPDESKEVSSSASFGDNETTMAKRFAIIFVVMMVFTIFFGVVMTAVMMP